MPTLDFTDVILSPELNDRFSVIRRTETVGDSGRATITETQTDNLIGIVTFGSGGNRRDEDAQAASRTLSVITQFRLREAAPGVQPDVVLYDGQRFTITKVEPWHRVGSGFVSAQAQAQAASVPPVV
jgi:outer membrane receptor protein involved in Fe transport